MKRIWKSLVCAVLSVAMIFALAACGGGFEAKTVKIVDAELEQFGIAVQKDVNTNDELVEAINEVIAEWSVKSNGTSKMEQVVNYYNSVYWDEEVEAPFTLHLDGKSDATATIKMATEPGFAPFEFLGENNKIVGLDVALMGEVAYRLNKKLTVVTYEFDALTPALFTGNHADCIAAGFTITTERQEAMDFSNPYFESTQYIICEEDADYDSVDDLKGLKIGVQKGTTGDYLVSDEIDAGSLKDSGAECKQYKSAPLAFEDLKKGTIQAIVVDELPAKALVERSK